jgi:flagellar basal body rod protein FlgB
LSDTPKIYAYGRYMDSDGITNIQICILCQRKYNILKTERKEGNSIIRELGEDIDYMRKEMKENAISYQKKIDFLQDKINILTNSVEKMDLFCEMNKNN